MGGVRMRVKISDVRASVWAGIGFLDAHVRGWRKKINLTTLDLSNNRCCVLGEIYGNYFVGATQLFGHDSEVAPSDFGFNLVNTYGADSYARLTAEWRAAYRAGQRAAKK